MSEQLRLQVLFDAVDRITAPLKKITDSSKQAGGTIKETTDLLAKLNKQKLAVDQFKKYTDQMKQTRTALAAARAAQSDLAKQVGDTFFKLRNTTEQQKAVNQQLKAADKVVKNLTAQLDRQTSSSKRARESLEKLGAKAGSQDALKAQIEKTNAALVKQRTEVERINKAAAHGAAIAGVGFAGMQGGKRIVRAAASPLGAFMQHEDAMMGVQRQVQGARDNNGVTAIYRQAEAEIRDLSTLIPQTTVEIAEMYTAAARMEVPTDKLRDQVLLYSDMATAFDAVPEEIAESMGKIGKNLNIPVDEMRGMADAINYLDDGAISKGADIIGFLNRTGGMAASVKISGKNMAALGSTLLTTGETEETAATSVNAMFTKFASATKGTKSFKAALSEIGISGQALEKGMATDAVATLLKVTEAINQLPEEKRMGVMAQLVGQEHTAKLAKIVTNTKELRRQIELANSAEADGSMAREAAARNSAISAQLQMQKNRAFNAMAIAGETLKQPLLDLLNLVNPLLEKFTKWMQGNPEAVGNILKLAIGLGALTTTLGEVAIVIGTFMAKAWVMLIVMAAMSTNITTLGSRFMFLWGLVRKFATKSPLLTFALGIAQMASAIIDRWDTIKDAFNAGDWHTVAVNLLEGFVSGINVMFLGLPGLISDLFWGLIEAAKAVLGIQSPSTVFAAIGSDLMQGLINGITSRLAAVREAITGAASQAIGWFKEKLGINSPSRVFMQLGGWVSEGAALGIQGKAGMVAKAATAMAALPALAAAPAFAQAPTLATPPSIAAASPARTAGAGDTYQITVHAAPGMDERALAQLVAQEIARAKSREASRGLSGYQER